MGMRKGQLSGSPSWEPPRVSANQRSPVLLQMPHPDTPRMDPKRITVNVVIQVDGIRRTWRSMNTFGKGIDRNSTLGSVRAMEGRMSHAVRALTGVTRVVIGTVERASFGSNCSRFSESRGPVHCTADTGRFGTSRLRSSRVPATDLTHGKTADPGGCGGNMSGAENSSMLGWLFRKRKRAGLASMNVQWKALRLNGTVCGKNGSLYLFCAAEARPMRS